MTTEEAIEILSDVGDINRCCAEDAEALDMAIKALEQQPCEDCISREETIKTFKNLNDVEGNNVFTQVGLYPWNVISELPSVQPKGWSGEWEYVQYDTPNIGNWHCSRCRGLYYSTDKPRWKFCPNCGARMEVEDE